MAGKSDPRSVSRFAYAEDAAKKRASQTAPKGRGGHILGSLLGRTPSFENAKKRVGSTRARKGVGWGGRGPGRTPTVSPGRGRSVRRRVARDASPRATPRRS